MRRAGELSIQKWHLVSSGTQVNNKHETSISKNDSVKDLSKKDEVDGYTRKFDATTIPLDGS